MGKTQSSDWYEIPDPSQIIPGSPKEFNISNYYNVTDNPGPLNTKISIRNDGYSTLFFICSILYKNAILASYELKFFYDIEKDSFTGESRNVIKGVGIPKKLPGLAAFIVILTDNKPISLGANVGIENSTDNNSYRKGDIYNFTLYGTHFPNYIKVNFLRDERGEIQFVDRPTLLTSTRTTVTIKSQTLIDGSDIGSTIFTVNGTVYQFCSIKIASVLIGEGSAKEKIITIFYSQPTNVTLTQFGDNIMTYALLRYILSKLLFGKFNVKYLLNKYYRKFLFDLKNSQYRNYLSYFINSDYQQYFR